MTEYQPNPLPIDVVLRQMLLEKRSVPPWVDALSTNILLSQTGQYPAEPLQDTCVFKTLWPFAKMTSDEINNLSLGDLALKLALLEIEDQDSLVNRLPDDLKPTFWDLIESSKPLEMSVT